MNYMQMNERYENMTENVMVTVIVVAYNQEEYIEQTLQSIVLQETNFKYEIIVRDDASTDSTTEIIKSYEKKYPEKIIAIIHDYNHFSQNDYSFNSVKEYIRGKYVAYCEGDDYYTDTHKLQKEVDILEKSEGCFFVAHKEQCVDADGNEMDKFYPIRDDIFPRTGLITNEEMARILFTISLYPFQTASYLVPNDTFMKCIDDSNPLCKITGVYLDIRLLLESLSRGDFYYIGECMAVYRYSARGSFSAEVYKDESKQRKLEIMLIKALAEYDNITRLKYHDLIRINFEYKYVDSFLHKDLEKMLLIHKRHRMSLARIWSGKVKNIESFRSKIYWTIVTLWPNIAVKLL